MKFSSAVDAYMADQRSQGRISSDASETVYRLRLNRLSDDISNRDPRYVNREDIKATLARWPNPNTQSHSRSIFVAFFDWLVEEGFRKDNPARATRPPKKREPQLYRLTRDETLAMMAAASTTREKRAIFLGFCAGLRNRELRGMQGKHFQRDGWVWVTKDIAKGGRERQVPVLAELEPVVADIRENVGLEEFVLPAQRFNPKSKRKVDVPTEGCSSDSLVRIVKRVSRNAGIPVEIKPHAMRHAFASYVIRFAGLRETQFFLGHKSLKTTEDYLNKPLLEELSAAVVGFQFGDDPGTTIPDGAVQVPLGNGAFALVDAEDFEYVKDQPWRLDNGYAKYCRTVAGKLRHYTLHRAVLHVPPGSDLRIDHINRNPLDCRKSNLRFATAAENAQNRAPGGNRGSSSRYRGVTWRERDQMWRAQVYINGKNHHVGEFKNEYQAAMAAYAFRRKHMPFAVEDPPLPPPDPSSAQSGSALAVNTASSDVPAQSGASAVLRALWGSERIRRAATEMALSDGGQNA